MACICWQYDTAFPLYIFAELVAAFPGLAAQPPNILMVMYCGLPDGTYENKLKLNL